MSDLELLKNINYSDLDSLKPLAFRYCKNFLDKAWSNVKLEDFLIERLRGGQENYVFKCHLNENFIVANKPKKPTEVILKIHGDTKRKNINYVHKDNLVTALIGDKGIGPKVYGIFELGRIEQYFPCFIIDQKEMFLPNKNVQVAKALAKFHTLEIPFLKDTKGFLDGLKNDLKRLLSIQYKESENMKFHEEFLSYNIENEFDELIRLIESINSPIVFCHNDVCFNNILKLNEDYLMLIDYEESAYNYRGFDFGAYFSGWMFNSGHNQFPYFTYNENGFPSNNDQIYFFNAYIEEYKNASKEENQNSLNLDQLLIEGKVFALLFHLNLGLWAMNQVESSKILFGFKEMTIQRCKAYFTLKKKFFNNDFSNCIIKKN